MNHPRKLFLNYRNNLLMLYKNLTPAIGRRVLFVRFWMDMLAAGLFLVKGEWSNVKSVFRAYRDFRRMKRNYRSAAVSRKGNVCVEPLERSAKLLLRKCSTTYMMM